MTSGTAAGGALVGVRASASAGNGGAWSARRNAAVGPFVADSDATERRWRDDGAAPYGEGLGSEAQQRGK